MSAILQLLYWYVMILAGGVGLVLASLFVALAVHTIRSAWISAGKDSGGGDA